MDDISTYFSKYLANKPKVVVSNPNEYYKKNYTSLRKRGLKKSGSTFF